ncbi:uncharacterized protein DUF2630 [Thermosporothrix hazakensis]|jgi:hypothetical protein|uniref:Uncharacterized protein DUF2630 n=2 Tax=Thermosporothrix TaxID=768650 RepID=A0A326U090_THEHA|nr:uncharacterized protein DUF2630 [Thermosporothrix hazakensis]BBH90468.1 hypothetical protein KTC_52190 [Thermosporothrix sp. COM3]GCE48521.1 hypothetical protein KTH_33900 [Thermosporothrix hazakensis]
MDDQDILKQISKLVDEEHALLQRAEKGQLQGDERQRVDDLKVRLDQCWDLLRQRRARRDFGMNPDDAQVRDRNIVEHYKQ